MTIVLPCSGHIAVSFPVSCFCFTWGHVPGTRNHSTSLLRAVHGHSADPSRSMYLCALSVLPVWALDAFFCLLSGITALLHCSKWRNNFCLCCAARHFMAVLWNINPVYAVPLYLAPSKDVPSGQICSFSRKQIACIPLVLHKSKGAISYLFCRLTYPTSGGLISHSLVLSLSTRSISHSVCLICQQESNLVCVLSYLPAREQLLVPRSMVSHVAPRVGVHPRWLGAAAPNCGGPEWRWEEGSHFRHGWCARSGIALCHQSRVTETDIWLLIKHHEFMIGWWRLWERRSSGPCLDAQSHWTQKHSTHDHYRQDN